MRRRRGGLEMNPPRLAHSTSPKKVVVSQLDERNDGRILAHRAHDIAQKSRTRWLGGTATEVGGKAVALSGCWGATETLDLGATRYQRFSLKRPGRVKNKQPLKQNQPHEQRAEEGPTWASVITRMRRWQK
jgi:hypothetical protein